MGKLRRGNFVFIWWIGDHLPPHVHVFFKGKEVAVWAINEKLALEGRVSGRLRKVIDELYREGVLCRIAASMKSK